MHTRTRTSAAALAIIVGLLALPAAAAAGGWATVELSSTPEDVKPGATWKVDIELLQHGRTPLDGVHPTVTITSADISRTFKTHPAGPPGVHRASVTFPRAGIWRYVVDDGFSARHSYPPVQIGAARAVAADRTPAYDRLVLAALAGIAASGLGWLLSRRRRTRLAVAAGS